MKNHAFDSLHRGTLKAAHTLGLVQVFCLLGPNALATVPQIPEAGFQNEVPKELQDVGIEQKLGSQIDLGLKFRDEDGKEVVLQKYFADGKAVLLTLAYYNCPSLCSFHLTGLKDSFKQMKAPIGQEFNVVTVSIDPKETSALASAKKANYIKSYGRPEGASGWHFLVGDAAPIRELAKELGFKYRWDAKAQQFAHASAAMIVTPDGHISRYFSGIDFEPKALRLSLVEASAGHVGTIIDKLTLFCFHYDPTANKYTLYAYNVMRAGAGLMVFIMAAFLAPFWFRKRKDQGEA
jgi:protein SCO1/2